MTREDWPPSPTPSQKPCLVQDVGTISAGLRQLKAGTRIYKENSNIFKEYSSEIFPLICSIYSIHSIFFSCCSKLLLKLFEILGILQNDSTGTSTQQQMAAMDLGCVTKWWCTNSSLCCKIVRDDPKFCQYTHEISLGLKDSWSCQSHRGTKFLVN